MSRPPARIQGADVLTWFSSLRPGAVCVVTGAPRSGKSLLGVEADEAGAFRRRIVFDPYGFRDRLEQARGRPCTPWPGDIGTARELLELVHSAPPGESILDQEELRLVVSARNLSPKALGRDFANVCEAVWNTGDIDILAEEAGLYSRQATDLIMRIASGGGHAGIRVFFFIQSLGRLQKDGRRHISHALLGPLGESEDRQDVRERCGESVADQVAQLVPGDPFIPWQLGQGITRRSITHEVREEGPPLPGRRGRNARVRLPHQRGRQPQRQGP